MFMASTAVACVAQTTCVCPRLCIHDDGNGAYRRRTGAVTVQVVAHPVAVLGRSHGRTIEIGSGRLVVNG